MAPGRFKILIVVAVLAGIALVVPHTTSFVVLLTTRALAFSILVMSLDLLLGFTGLASLGQAAYLGIGAYAVGRSLGGPRLAYRYFRYMRTRHHALAESANPTLVLGRAADAEVLLRAIESGIRPTATRPPSSGNSGNKLKIPSTTLMNTEARAI